MATSILQPDSAPANAPTPAFDEIGWLLEIRERCIAATTAIAFGQAATALDFATDAALLAAYTTFLANADAEPRSLQMARLRSAEHVIEAIPAQTLAGIEARLRFTVGMCAECGTRGLVEQPVGSPIPDVADVDCFHTRMLFAVLHDIQRLAGRA